MSKNNIKIIIALLLIVAALIVMPVVFLKGKDFAGSDDTGSKLIEEINEDYGNEYEPWFTPVLENVIGGEIPGEIESLIFCLQTGIGVGIIAFYFGRFTERKKWIDTEKSKNKFKNSL